MGTLAQKAQKVALVLAAAMLCSCIRVYYVTIKNSPGVTLYVVADVPKKVDAAADIQAVPIP
jgi:hypothetical protein